MHITLRYSRNSFLSQSKHTREDTIQQNLSQKMVLNRFKNETASLCTFSTTTGVLYSIDISTETSGEKTLPRKPTLRSLTYRK